MDENFDRAKANSLTALECGVKKYFPMEHTSKMYINNVSKWRTGEIGDVK